jgi:hypothetical protein
MHRIRLHARWTVIVDGREASIDLPSSFSGQVIQLRRAFGQPKLASGERVFIVFDEFTGISLISMNGVELSRDERVEITDQLQPRNLLELYAESGCKLGEIRLEIG